MSGILVDIIEATVSAFRAILKMRLGHIKVTYVWYVLNLPLLTFNKTF